MTTDAPAQREAGLFRKKPVFIEAWQWDGHSTAPERPEWVNASCEARLNKELIVVKTLEGTMFASKGDWLIRGVKGEVYPCKPDIFSATYTEATTPANPEPDEAVVERVKQAIYLSHYTVGDVPLSRQPKQIDRHCEKLARAALAAATALPKVEASDLERTVGFLWPCYTDDKLPKLEYAARDPRCLRLAAQFAAARQAGRDEAIRELREHPEKLRAKLNQHPSYSCECLDIAADYLAANRPLSEPSK